MQQVSGTQQDHANEPVSVWMGPHLPSLVFHLAGSVCPLAAPLSPWQVLFIVFGGEPVLTTPSSRSLDPLDPEETIESHPFPWVVMVRASCL